MSPASTAILATFCGAQKEVMNYCRQNQDEMRRILHDCQSPQQYVHGLLGPDHIIPVAIGGTDAEDNLWLAYRLCNGFKGTQTHTRDLGTSRRVRLFNRSRQRWARHFLWSDDGTRIIGRAACGRATVVALQLNHAIAVIVRREGIAAEPGARLAKTFSKNNPSRVKPPPPGTF